MAGSAQASCTGLRMALAVVPSLLASAPNIPNVAEAMANASTRKKEEGIIAYAETGNGLI